MQPGATEDRTYFQAKQCGTCGVQTSTATILFVQVLRISYAIII